MTAIANFLRKKDAAPRYVPNPPQPWDLYEWAPAEGHAGSPYRDNPIHQPDP